MKTKHTPGPWSVGKFGSDCRIYADPDKHAIARTYGPDLNGIGVCDLTGPMNKADARLISASPDMLEALQEIVCAADCNGWDQLDPLLSKARAAIAKATR